jgi:hypothetical protein
MEAARQEGTGIHRGTLLFLATGENFLYGLSLPVDD